jgi:hypothetical protein
MAPVLQLASKRVAFGAEGAALQFIDPLENKVSVVCFFSSLAVFDESRVFLFWQVNEEVDVVPRNIVSRHDVSAMPTLSLDHAAFRFIYCVFQLEIED